MKIELRYASGQLSPRLNHGSDMGVATTDVQVFIGADANVRPLAKEMEMIGAGTHGCIDIWEIIGAVVAHCVGSDRRGQCARDD